jgi:hypothetical protein
VNTNYDTFNECLKEIGSKLHYGRADAKLDKLFKTMNDEKVLPFEYINYVYLINPEMVCKNALCSEKAWYPFLEDRRNRMAENKIKSELQKKRLRYLLKDEKLELEEIVVSNLETFFIFFRYIMACIREDEKLKDEFRTGAIYEVRTMPELFDLFAEFSDQHDLKREDWTNGGLSDKE